MSAARPLDEVEDGCRVGEKLDCAELGRSGIRRAANWAFFCAAIVSLSEDRAGAFVAFTFEVALAALETEAEKEAALGLLESFSSSC